MLLVSPVPVLAISGTISSPNSCRFSFSPKTLHHRSQTDSSTASVKATSTLLPLAHTHTRSLTGSFRRAPPPSPLALSARPLGYRSSSSTIGTSLKRAYPDTPASPADIVPFERQRYKLQRQDVNVAGGLKPVPKPVHTVIRQGAKAHLYGQGEERECSGRERKELGAAFNNGTAGQKSPLHRLRLIKGMSTSTASGRVRARPSLSLDTASVSAQTPSTAASVVVSPYHSDPANNMMASSPVAFDIPPAPATSAYRLAHSTASLHSYCGDSATTPSSSQPPPMKRPNIKRLSLSLTIPPTPTSCVAATASTFTTPAASEAASTATEYTPYTPGPPMTPAALIPMSLGRAATKPGRRPNLMSLITQLPTNHADVPPTPSLVGSSPFSSMAGPSARVTNPYATIREGKRRSYTTEEQSSGHAAFPPMPMFRSAHPRIGSCDPISESDNGSATPSTSTAHSRTHSNAASTSTSVSNPPPARQTAYADGPVELVPGVFLGAEESVHDYHTWASTSRVRILNVAQELDHPWAAQQTDRKGKGKAVGAFYPADPAANRPDVEYRHLMWSHGEAGLAEIDGSMDLGELISGQVRQGASEEREGWRFWEAIQWIEEGRRRGERVLIHCQCGISRSATLSVAYLMALAATGIMPEHLGHLTGMQDAYAFVKAKSACIGPNVSLVFQLVEFARNLTTLLEKHLAANPDASIITSFPKASSTRQSEAEWARQRAAFDDADADAEQEVLLDCEAPKEDGAEQGKEHIHMSPVTGLPAVQGMSIRDMQREAEELDEAMRQRRLRV